MIFTRETKSKLSFKHQHRNLESTCTLQSNADVFELKTSDFMYINFPPWVEKKGKLKATANRRQP